MKEIDIKQIENTQFPDEIVWAVRYGYMYRNVAEEQSNDSIQLNYCLSDVPAILCWLAQQIVGGATYDILKKAANSVWNKLMQMKVSIPDDVNKVLLDEDELRRFVSFVDEFDNKALSATKKEIEYIRDEIIADYVGKASGDIWEREMRLPNHEEWKSIHRDANSFADKLLNKSTETQE